MEYARRVSMRDAQSSTTSANASLPAARSSTGSRRHSGATRKKVYTTYWPSTVKMLARRGRANARADGLRALLRRQVLLGRRGPAVAGPDERRLGLLAED